MSQFNDDKAGWRDKNKAGNLMSRILKHANGEVEMTNTQLRAAEIFLRKTLPDLTKATLTGNDDQPLIPQRSVVELVRPTPKDS